MGYAYWHALWYVCFRVFRGYLSFEVSRVSRILGFKVSIFMGFEV
jgi:hypothetical protein